MRFNWNCLLASTVPGYLFDHAFMRSPFHKDIHDEFNFKSLTEISFFLSCGLG